jgi:iduronate 2-sulfatase
MKRLILFTALLGFAAGALSAHAAKPNVLLILVDDLKPVLGTYGDQTAVTPAMDKFATSGMRFDLAYANQAVCAPSRYNLMLGSRSTSTGMYGLGGSMRAKYPDAVTLPQYFSKHGYYSQSLGKVFHIGHGNPGDPASFDAPHFKDFVVEYVLSESTRGQLTREEAFFNNIKTNVPNKQLARGAAWESAQVGDEAYADGRVAAETIRRLEAWKKNPENPFFIASGYARPHLPFTAPKKYWDLYDPAKLPLPKVLEAPADAPEFAVKRGGEIEQYFPVPENAEIGPNLARQLIHGYYASVSYVDAQIGKVLDAVDRLGLADNTIVVLWGDHGFHLGDHGMWTKHTNYEQATRIPLLIRAPGVTKPGSATRQPAETVDIYPTLAELAGLPAPEVPQPLDGLSLVPVLSKPDARVRDHAYHAFPRGAFLGRAIRTERYRLVEWTPLRNANGNSRTALELYDFETDPLETRNLAAAQPEVVKQLNAILVKHPKAVPPGRE